MYIRSSENSINCTMIVLTRGWQGSTTQTRANIGFGVGIARLNRGVAPLLFFDQITDRRPREVVATHDAIDVIGIKRLIFEKRLGHRLDLVTIAFQQLARLLEKRVDQLFYFFINRLGGLLGIFAAGNLDHAFLALIFTVIDEAQSIAHLPV